MIEHLLEEPVAIFLVIMAVVLISPFGRNKKAPLYHKIETGQPNSFNLLHARTRIPFGRLSQEQER